MSGQVIRLSDVLDQDTGALLAEKDAQIAALQAELAEERTEKEALRAETERLYRICEDEVVLNDLFAVSNKLISPMHKIGLWAYYKQWPTMAKNDSGLGETIARDIAPLMGGNKDNILSALTRGKKLGLINKPKPHRKKLLHEGTNKPILDERTGKPKYTSRLFTSKTDRWDDLTTLRDYVQPELLRAHGGTRTKKEIPTCPTCGLPADKEHATLHCPNNHTWEVTTDFEAEAEEVKRQDDISLDDQELVSIFDEVEPEETPSEMARCHPIEDIEGQDDISEPALEELRRYAQFVCWRYGSLNLATGKRKKIPLNPKTCGQASVTAPDTWGTYDEALALKNRARLVDGIGFVFTDSDPFIGLDLDGCIDENGIVSDQAAAIISALDSYPENSPSHTGLHIIVKGELPAAIKTSAIEMYSTGRYFTFTGEQLPGTPGTIEARQAEITALYQQIAPPAPAIAPEHPCASIATDDDLMLLSRALQDDKFARLMAGDTSDYGGDESRADMALVRKLAFYTGNDPARIDALFQQSSLYRPKWHEKRGAMTYGALTIAKIAGDDPPVHTRPQPSPETAPALREAVGR